jgi:hypothetical protein
MVLAPYVLRHELNFNNISLAKVSRLPSALDGTISLDAERTSSLTSISAAMEDLNLPMPGGTSALESRTA